jgi:hypothetical protein
MKQLTTQFKKFRSLILIALAVLQFSCVGAIVGAAVDTTIEVAKVPFKVVGAAVDLAVPDDDDD